MSLTNTEQCLGARTGKTKREGSRDTQRGDRNDNRGNSRFANPTSIGDTDNLISHLSITKDGPRSIQLTKILEAIPFLRQDNHYDYISDIISINIEPTQEEFLSDYLIKRRNPSKHHVKLGVVDPIIGLDVPSGNSPINSEMVEITPISNTNPQVLYHSDRNEGSFSRSHEWDKLIANKKSIMELILSQCDETTGGEITLGQSPKYDVMTGGFFKFIKQLSKVCTHLRARTYFSGQAYLSSLNSIFSQHLNMNTIFGQQ